ncbi:MAG: molybdate ABC transporter substrate-binding protein, partial [Verrucomicrobiota bacterium]
TGFKSGPGWSRIRLQVSMKFRILTAAALLLLAGLLLVLIQPGGKNEGSDEELRLHCAAGLRKPVSAIVEAYERQFGTRIQVQFAGSGALASQLEVAGGDLYFPADISYIDLARQKGLLDESIPVAWLTAGIAVGKGNPKGIQSLEDLTHEGITISLGNPSAAIGKFTRKVLEGAGVWSRVEPNVSVYKPTVNNVAEDVALSTVDAAIVWDAVAAQFEEVEFVNVPEFDARRKTATIGVLSSSTNPTRALHFARFLSSTDQGQPAFAREGFQVHPGADKWDPLPEITFFSGSMLRPAIEDQLRAFQEREGVRISVIYEGCGTLVSQMKAGARPDAYFSCDLEFLEQVQDRFEEGTIVTSNEIVLLVPKGNPRQLAGPSDLLQQELKVGLSDPKKSALGFLTRKLLQELNLYRELQANGNVIVLASKGDELVNQMQLGALDAALLYRSNAMASPQIMEHCEIVALNQTSALATQPYAVHRNSKHKQLMNRLREFLTDDEGKGNFLQYGFHWKMDGE